MQIKAIHSGMIYEKMMLSEKEKRTDIYRYELMQPFEKKWACIKVPLHAKYPGGYDVIMASKMLGFLSPEEVDERHQEEIERLKDKSLWESCGASIERALSCFEAGGIELKVKDYLYTLTLAHADSPYIRNSDGYLGDGGIPGYIFITLIPKDYSIRRLPSVLAHECNHNVRYQYIKWNNNVTLAEMLVTEGLAESFATALYGEEYIGPWVSKTSKETLNEVVKPIIKQGLNKQGLDQITAYLYGDELAQQQGYFPVGLPYCAGYACGYDMIQYYLKKTGDSIVKATIRPAEEILETIKEYWV